MVDDKDGQSHGFDGGGPPREDQRDERGNLLSTTPMVSERGWLHLSSGDYDLAVTAFEQALALVSTDEGALQGKIMALRLLGRYEDAEVAIEEALGLLPGNAGVLVEEAWLRLQQKEYDKALTRFAAILASTPNDERALEGRISALRSLGRHEDAEEAIEEALSRVPGSPVLLVHRGWLALRPDRFDQALAAFEEVLALVPNDERALEGRITALRSLGRHNDAEEAMDEALSRLPASPAILYQRAQLCLDRGDYDLAMFAFQGIVVMLVQRGWEYVNKKRFDQALTAFEDALALAPNDASALEGKVAALRCRDQPGSQ